MTRETWTGAYPELAAYDYFAQANDFAYSVPKLHVELPVAETFAQELGMVSVNLDGLYDEFGLYFDVKALKDNVKEILENAYSQAERELGMKLHIAHEYANDSSFLPFQRNFSDLVSEIVAAVKVNRRVEYIKSSVIPNLSFRLAWGDRVLMTESTYSPYKHAEQLHASVFNYASKFVKNQKFVLVVVVFPWSNLTVNDFAGSNLKFYRSLARRVFMQYSNDPTLFKMFNPKYTGGETVHQVSKKLTGILFLEDKCILSNDPSSVNAKGYFYANPNADNSLGMFEDYLMNLQLAAFDDFQADNY